jgi:hypothetical protein
MVADDQKGLTKTQLEDRDSKAENNFFDPKKNLTIRFQRRNKKNPYERKG